MRRLLIFLLFWPALALAGPLPDAATKRILRDPDGWMVQATRLIAGFGGPGGLTAAGLARHVAIERAAARAGALRDLLVADLDGDGAVSGPEAADYMQVLSARGRGGFLVALAAADADGDGSATGAELRAAADAAALDALPPAEEARLEWVLAFDANGDGAVTLGEMRQGVAALAGKS